MSGIYVVIGANGQLGRQLVNRLTEQHEGVTEIRALVRNPAKCHELRSQSEDFPSIKLLRGDCTDSASLTASFANAEGVFFAARGPGFENSQAVDRDGVLKTAIAAKAAGVRRVLLVTSQLVDPVNRFHPIRALLNTIVTGALHWQGMMDFKHQGEDLLRSSGQECTTVRPGALTNGPLNNATVRLGQTNGTLGSPISRADVACVCVAAMMPEEGDATVNTTFELGCDPPPKEGGPKPDSFSAVAFKGLFGANSQIPVP